MRSPKGRFFVAVASSLIFSEIIFMSGGVVFAQTTTDVVESSPAPEIIAPPAEETTPPTTTPDIILPPEAVPDETVSTTTDSSTGTDLQGASSTPQLQETFSDQQTIPPSDASTTEIVVSTSTDPAPPVDDGDATTTEESTSTDSMPPVDEGGATTTEESTSTDLLPPSDQETPPEEATPTDPLPPPDPTPPQVEQQQNQHPMVISAEELKPKPQYVFSITGKKTSASRRVRRTVMEKSRPIIREVNEEVSNVPTMTTDNTTGVMSVSGACEDKYYVILVYKHEEDYTQDPGSYVVNRSFPCVGGSFSYDVVNLPPALPDGNYYLLVGSMGDSGPWTPITGITEVTLARSH